jgi:hypothetical protein
MPITSYTPIHGISAFGSWTATSVTAGGGATTAHNADNIYTKTSWGYTSEEGARIVPTVNRIEQRSGQSAAVLDSFIESVSGQLQIRMLSGHLENLRRMMGLPASALTGDLSAGTPTKEVLRVSGALLGTEEQQLYVETMGPLAARTYFFPRAKVSSFPEQTHSRTEYFEPNASFDLYEETVGNDLYWVEDAEA